MNIVMENLLGISYKLIIIGVPISGPSYIYGDTILVINSTQRPKYSLKKKSHSICYCVIHESIAMGKFLTGHVGTNENCANLSTKVLYGGKRRFHVSNLLFDI